MILGKQVKTKIGEMAIPNGVPLAMYSNDSPIFMVYDRIRRLLGHKSRTNIIL